MPTVTCLVMRNKSCVILFSFLEPKPTPPPEDDNLFGNVPPEKMLQFSIILAELNNKIGRQNFKPS